MRTKLLASLCLLAAPAFAQDSLARVWRQLRTSLPVPGNQPFVMPKAVEMLEFEDAMLDLLRGRVTLAKLPTRARELEYSATVVGPFWVLTDSSWRGQGIFILNQAYTRNLIVEAPHPGLEAGIVEEGLAIFTQANARALFIAGSHPCADVSVPSGCSGTTLACGKEMPFPISDAGHSDRTFFNAAHNAALHMDPKPLALSLHGNASEPVQAELSDGTRVAAAADSLVIRFRYALEKNGVNVGSCNWPPDEALHLTLCGTANVQGRESNGSPQACRQDATAATGLFLHLDQRAELRESFDAVVQAVIETVPVK